MVIHSPEFRRKRQKRRRIISAIVFGTLAVLIGLAVFLSHMERFLVKEIVVSGNHVTRADEIKAIAENSMSGKYFWLFPKSNSVLYPKKAIREALVSDIPRIKSAELNIRDSNILEIIVDERKPDSLFCQNVESVLAPEECYFLDENGFIFSKSPSFSGDVYFIYTATERTADPIGKEVLPVEQFGYVSKFVKQIRDIGVYARVFEISPDTHKLILPNTGQIIWKSTEDPRVVEHNLRSFLTEGEISKQKDFLDKILYIDLRFDNKVFYKFQE